MKIEVVSASDLIPYEKNAKLHPQKQIDQIKSSIEQFGNNDPIAIDENNVIIEGHGRFEALKQLGVKKIECIRLTHLTEEQKKAYILVHNKLTMNSGFDLEILSEELQSIIDIDMGEFDFDVMLDFEELHQEYKENTQDLKEGILNLGYQQFDGVGKYDIPEILPTYELPQIDSWMGFNYVLSDKRPKEEKKRTGIHFFVDDYQFERVWNSPEAYLDKLREYGAVLSPDFSPYGDMPLITQMYNHYRKHWCGRYWQENGITVIPTIRASSDTRSYEWFLDGEPKDGIVAISSMWDNKNEPEEERMRMINIMIKELNPSSILVYGKEIDCLKYKQLTYIKSFCDKWRQK